MSELDTGPLVAYIGGSGRSGSTLLDRILDQVPDFVSVGELVKLWGNSPLPNRLCGCGDPLLACPFWTAVTDITYGGFDTPEFAAARQLLRSVTRSRHLPMLVAPRMVPAFARRVDEAAGHLERLYAAIGKVSGAGVIVDSSKEAPYAAVLRRVIGQRLRLVHLVRDAHGVSYSWTKTVTKPEQDNPSAQLHRYPPAQMALRWVGYNGVLDLIGATVPSVVVRYESVAADPVGVIEDVLRVTGRSPVGHVDHIDGGTVTLRPSHSVAGNPMRFRQGQLPLRLDEEWRTEMSGRNRAVVTVLSSPMLLRYGYLGRSRRAGGAAGDR